MPNIHPTKSKKNHERALRVWRAVGLFAEGYTQQEIADEIGVCKATVCGLLADARKRFEEDIVKDLAKYRAAVYWNLQNQYTIAMDAWHRSGGEHKKTKTIYVLNGEQRAEVIKEEQVGDPRYLAEARHCLEQICKLIGLYAPEKAQVDITVSPITAEMRVRVVEDPTMVTDIMSIERRLFGEASDN